MTYYSPLLNQENKPPYYNKHDEPICEPCHEGHHEHHQQGYWSFNDGKDIQWGEGDCKNTITHRRSNQFSRGQCLCFQQPTGDRYDGGVRTRTTGAMHWDGEKMVDQSLTCLGCITIISDRPIDYYGVEALRMCVECGSRWKVIKDAACWGLMKGPVEVVDAP